MRFPAANSRLNFISDSSPKLILFVNKPKMDEDSEDEESESQKGTPILEEVVEEEEEKTDPRAYLTEQQIHFYRNIFASFDTDKKEKIPTKSIGFVLRILGFNPTKAELREHMKQMDPGNRGTIDFHAFLLPIAQRLHQEPENHEDIIAAFRIFDEEGEGFVYSDVLVEYLTTLGEDLDDYELELLLKAAETKGTKKIHYVEFVEKMFGIIRKTSKKDKADKKKEEDKKKGGKKKKKK